MKGVQVFWIACVIGIIYAEYFDAFTTSINNVWRAIKDALRKPLRARTKKNTAMTTITTTTMNWFFETKPDNEIVLEPTGKPVIIPIFTSPRAYRTPNDWTYRTPTERTYRTPTERTAVMTSEMEINDIGYKK